jgi:signal recognition particle subunit SRP54
MFSNLSEKINGVLSGLGSKGVLRESDIDKAMREIRVALLEADVALSVAKDFIDNVKEKALGQDVIKSVKPGHMVTKIVQDELVRFLGDKNQAIDLKSHLPTTIMVVGLQGSGKTTSTAKLAKLIEQKYNKKTLVSSLDVYRPAAQKQLEVLCQQNNLSSVEIIAKEKPVEIAKRSLSLAKKNGNDVLLLDTAGRLHIDADLMDELQQIKQAVQPTEILLVVDSLIGQDAVNVAKEFHEKIGITGVILTRLDGDSRGGAALSIKHVTGQPIKFAGVGEKIDEFEEFFPDRIASRILDKGDIVSLVEKASAVFGGNAEEKMMKKMQSGKFNFNDLLDQMRNMNKLGGIGSIMGMIPGISKMKSQIESSGLGSGDLLKKQEAMILSMTKRERSNPPIINASRRKRIADGSGCSLHELNKLIKQQQQMENMMKKMKKMDPKSMMRGGLGELMNMFK